MGKDDFKYLSPEFDSKVLDLVKKERFYPNEYISDFEEFPKKSQSKERFYSFLFSKKVRVGGIRTILRFRINLK